VGPFRQDLMIKDHAQSGRSLMRCFENALRGQELPLDCRAKVAGDTKDK
jgi:hypothetical protein